MGQNQPLSAAFQPKTVNKRVTKHCVSYIFCIFEFMLMPIGTILVLELVVYK